MARTKLKKFAELKKLPNVLELDTFNFDKKIKKLFPKNKEVVLELGCGKGEYTIALASRDTDKQYIGVDIQGERLWHGAKEALEKKLKNVFFLRLPIEQIDQHLPEKSVSEIWLTFPDPFPRKKQSKKRLVAPIFLQRYQKILKPKGVINLKTDNRKLFYFAIKSGKENGFKIIAKKENIYQYKNPGPKLRIKTYFETKHLLAGRKIYYLKIQCNTPSVSLRQSAD